MLVMVLVSISNTLILSKFATLFFITVVVTVQLDYILHFSNLAGLKHCFSTFPLNCSQNKHTEKQSFLVSEQSPCACSAIAEGTVTAPLFERGREGS